MEAIILVVLAVAVAAVVLVSARRYLPPRRTELTRTDPAPATRRDREGRVVLDLVAADPQAPAVQRLAYDAANRTLATGDADVVVVVDRDGTTLATVRADEPLPPAVALPASLHEPHARRSRTPSPVGHEPSGTGTQAAPGEIGDAAVPARVFADRFDLLPAIRQHLEDPEHPADVVRAILTAGGRTVERHGELVVADDVAVVVADVAGGAEAALSRAYVRVRESGAPHGIVIRLGYADPALVRRRDAAAPEVRHTGTDAIQRMADAVALGADPVSFAAEPLLAGRPTRR